MTAGAIRKWHPRQARMLDRADGRVDGRRAGLHEILTVLQGLKVQLRVIFSLVLREARVRHGRSRLGYAWAIIEPAAVIIFLTILFSQIRSGSASGIDFATFFATGVLPFQMFRSTSQYVALAIDANRPLFNYLPVKPIDAVIARSVLEICTLIVVMILVYGFHVIVLDAPLPRDMAGLSLVIFLTWLMAFGAGLCLAVGRRYLPSLPNIYGVMMGASFFVSCVFYSLSAVPSHLREILVWNPIVHIVEGFRGAYFGAYRTPDVDLFYLFIWGITLVFVGLLIEPAAKRKLEA
jgi:capsular polysaccharide transport system permease protein